MFPLHRQLLLQTRLLQNELSILGKCLHFGNCIISKNQKKFYNEVEENYIVLKAQ